MDDERVRLEPLVDKRLEAGNDVHEIKSVVEMDENMTEVEAANVADALEEFSDILRQQMFFFILMDVKLQFFVLASILFVFDVEIDGHLKRICSILLESIHYFVLILSLNRF